MEQLSAGQCGEPCRCVVIGGYLELDRADQVADLAVLELPRHQLQQPVWVGDAVAAPSFD
ncbi:MAG: hypothetical protein EA388_13545 [Nitriliruptor sp.]|nr:MAG: hypothetical protein EA388_13545 [Nitriliruptor sp.]